MEKNLEHYKHYTGIHLHVCLIYLYTQNICLWYKLKSVSINVHVLFSNE